MFNVTEKAAKEIERLLIDEEMENAFLRIRVVPGGCSGFSYNFTIDKILNCIKKQIEVAITKLTKTRLNDRTFSSWKSLKDLKNLTKIYQTILEDYFK